jgi:uncharacterized phage protein (TIGR02216 family)
MTFSDAAAKLAAQTALHLGWRPDEFWNATPAELVGILQTLAGHNEAPPSADAIADLMMQFPDTPSGDI